MRDKVVVLTGASAGIGRATARILAARGARLALVARGDEGLKGARRDCEELGAQVVDIRADVSNHEEVEEAAQRAERELGPIDVWINNAMNSVFEPVWRISPEDLRRVTDVTYHGYAYGTMAALRRMMARDHGVIVQVGSALAYRGIPWQSAYCGAKHAIQGFTESLRSELYHERSNVRISMVQLPAVNTPQFHWVKTTMRKHPQPVPPIYQPEVAARAIVYAAEHERAELWLGGKNVLGILANRVVPRLLDRYLGWKGVEAQQAPFPIEPGRRDNLYAPVDEEQDHGAHGEFDDRAKPMSAQWWLNTHRAVAAAGAAGAAVASIALARAAGNGNGNDNGSADA